MALKLNLLFGDGGPLMVVFVTSRPDIMNLK